MPCAASSKPPLDIRGGSPRCKRRQRLGIRGDRSMDITWLDWTSGTCMLLRRACLDEIGNLDARLQSYCEDVDLGQRANSAGWRVGKVGGAAATERGSSMGSSYARRQIRANWMLLAFKRLGWRGLVVAAAAQALLSVKVASRAVVHPSEASRNLPIARDNFAALFIAARRLPAFFR